MSESSRAEKMKNYKTQISEVRDLMSASEDSPIQKAVREFDLSAAQRLLDEGAEVNGVDSVGMTPLMRAVVSIKLVSESGALPGQSSGKLMQDLADSFKEEIKTKAPEQLARSITSMLPTPSSIRQTMLDAQQRKRQEADSDQPGQLVSLT